MVASVPDTTKKAAILLLPRSSIYLFSAPRGRLHATQKTHSPHTPPGHQQKMMYKKNEKLNSSFYLLKCQS
jgi:hypothetical protein